MHGFCLQIYWRPSPDSVERNVIRIEMWCCSGKQFAKYLISNITSFQHMTVCSMNVTFLLNECNFHNTISNCVNPFLSTVHDFRQILQKHKSQTNKIIPSFAFVNFSKSQKCRKLNHFLTLELCFPVTASTRHRQKRCYWTL